MSRLSFALLCLAVSACGSGGPPGGPPQMPPMPVKVAVLKPSPIDESSEYVASVRSLSSTTIRPQVDGFVTKIYVKSGDKVAKGTPLLQIDPRRQQATVTSQVASHAAQEASVAFAKQQLDRAKQLFAAGANSRQDLEQAQSNYDSAVAQLNSLEARVKQEEVSLQYYQVLSPEQGIVGDIPIRLGDRVTPDTTLTTVDRNQSLEVLVSVPLERGADLKMGLPIEVLDTAGNKLTETKISFVSPRVDDQTQSILVKGIISGADVKVRQLQFVHARVIWRQREGLVVPVVAVLRINGAFFVYKAETKDGKTVARQTPVRLGAIVKDDYTVLGGLQANDQVVISGVQKIGDGAPINPQA